MSLGLTRPRERHPSGSRAGILLAIAGAASLAACETPGGGPAVVTATIVDSTGQPFQGAYAELRLQNDSGVVVTADSSGRVRLELAATGPGTATFASRLTAPQGERVSTPLLFGPEEADLEVRLGGDSAGIVYPTDGPVMSRWGRAVALRRAVEEGYMASQDAWIEAGQHGRFDPGVSPLADSVKVLLKRERNPEVRSALWVAVLATSAPGAEVTPDTADLALDEVPPGAAVWAVDPTAVASWVWYAATLAEGVDLDNGAESGPDQAGRQELANRRSDAYLDRVLSAQAEDVRPGLLLGALRLATAIGRPDAADGYYEQLVAGYPGSREATLAENLAPGNRPGVGDPVPDVSFPALDSTAPFIGPDDLAGPATLVDFWAVWCTPCVAEVPNIEATYERFAPRGFRVVSVSFDASREDVRRFRTRQPMPWEHAFVGIQELLGHGEVVTAYGIAALPYAVLVGPDGTIQATGDELRGERLTETLERLLPEG